MATRRARIGRQASDSLFARPNKRKSQLAGWVRKQAIGKHLGKQRGAVYGGRHDTPKPSLPTHTPPRPVLGATSPTEPRPVMRVNEGRAVQNYGGATRRRPKRKGKGGFSKIDYGR